MSEAFRGFVCTSAAIDAAVEARSMLAHPFYQAWEQGENPCAERLHRELLA